MGDVMKCLVCGNLFNVKREFKDLFRVQKVYVCDKCIKDNPLHISFHYLPLTNHQLEVVSLFEKPYVNYDGFIYEYSKIYEKLSLERKGQTIYLYDSFVLKEKTLEEFDILSNELDEDIIILTNTYLS